MHDLYQRISTSRGYNRVAVTRYQSKDSFIIFLTVCNSVKRTVESPNVPCADGTVMAT